MTQARERADHSSRPLALDPIRCTSTCIPRTRAWTRSIPTAGLLPPPRPPRNARRPRRASCIFKRRIRSLLGSARTPGCTQVPPAKTNLPRAVGRKGRSIFLGAQVAEDSRPQVGPDDPAVRPSGAGGLRWRLRKAGEPKPNQESRGCCPRSDRESLIRGVTTPLDDNAHRQDDRAGAVPSPLPRCRRLR